MPLNATVLLPGQYLWLHDIRQAADGTPAGVVALALSAKARGILAKYDDGQSVSLSDGEQWQAQCRALAGPCAAAGLLLIPWGYVYPTDRTLFASIAAQAIADAAPANPQGFYCLDVEVEFDNDANPAYDAGQVLADLRADVPRALLLYTSWGWVDQHPAFPWSGFQAGCQGFMPQIYPGTLQAGVDAGTYWNRAYGGARFGGPNPGTGPAGWVALSPQIPVVPTFDFAGDVAALAGCAHNFGSPAICWWVMDGMTAVQAQTLAATPYATTTQPPPATSPPPSPGSTTDVASTTLNPNLNAERWGGAKNDITQTLITGGGPTTTSTTAVSTGIGLNLAPSTARVLLQAAGTANNNTSGGGFLVYIYRNVTSIPSLGTSVGSDTEIQSSTGISNSVNESVPWSMVTLDTGLTSGTTYYYYLAFAAVSAGTLTLDGRGAILAESR